MMISESLTISTELKASLPPTPGNTKSLMARGTRNTMAKSDHQAMRRETLVAVKLASAVLSWMVVCARPA